MIGVSRLAAAFALASLGLLGGCQRVPEPDRKPPTAVLLMAGRQIPFVRDMARGFGYGVTEIGGVEIAQIGPESDDSMQQLRNFQRYRDGEHGSVAFFTLAPELFADSLHQAAEAGTPLMALHSLPSVGSGVGLYVGPDNTALGTRLAAAVARRIPDAATGVVVIGSPSPGVEVLDDRVAGVRAEMERLRPDLTVIGPFDTKQDVEGNLRAWTVLQKANPGAVAYIGVAGQDSLSLAKLRRPGIARTDGAMGIGDLALEEARQGGLVLASTEPFLIGWLAGVVQARSSRYGTPLPEGWLETPTVIVDEANASEIIARQQTEQSRLDWFRRQGREMADHTDEHLRPLDEAS
ncbi:MULTISPECIES: sugar ABC transporter substrate-binding protein [Actinoplanes]|uniref:sugar ABC transporter substrate-binding protein n=1 Tax=Actinoplanes TaxID=1865 RepID=UPI0005F29F9E|nr:MULTISPECIES: sugar ABC transporter substrate-binding protein [Actinoplanes]GLY04447.1 hypothetical protein Acsp01_48260 [Actinoplanes sp. NBRC 101535]